MGEIFYVLFNTFHFSTFSLLTPFMKDGNSFDFKVKLSSFFLEANDFAGLWRHKGPS